MTKLALIGCGKWGKNYLKTLTSIETCELAWVCDLDPQKLKEAAVAFPQIRYTEHVTDILTDATVEGVIIATTPDSHYEVAHEFISQGKAVLVEKPVTITRTESIDLLNLATSRNTILMAGYTLLYHPIVRQSKALLAGNPPYYINTSRTNPVQVAGVDVLHDLAVHDIYLSRYLMGEDPTWLMAQAGRYLESPTNNVIYILLGFPNGGIASVFASFIHTHKTRAITLVTPTSKLVFDDVQPTHQKLELFEEAQHKYVCPDDNLEPLTHECLHFIECIREHKEPQSGKEAIAFVAKITDYIATSLAKGGAKITL